MLNMTPVVATDYSAKNTPIIDGYNGFITNDEEQMRERLILLFKNPKLAAQLGQNARKTIETEFSIQRFTNDWNTLFKKVLR